MANAAGACAIWLAFKVYSALAQVDLGSTLATLNRPASAQVCALTGQTFQACKVEAKAIGSIIQRFCCDTYKHVISSLVCVVVL